MTKIYHNKGKIYPSPPPSAALLLPEEREVLCYFLTSNKCDCFECYTRYWARWDTSPNRHVIHEILEAYEDELVGKSKKKRRNKSKNKKRNAVDEKVVSREMNVKTESDLVDLSELASRGDDVALEKGPVRKIVGFIGEKIWGVLGK